MAVPAANDRPLLRAALPFRPNSFQLDQMPLFEQNEIPRYLFRISAPNSAGQTTDSFVIPPASGRADKYKIEDIFRLSTSPVDAAMRLNEHFRWWRPHERKCNLMSWTSSLLFALQHGLRRHKTDVDNPDLSKIFLFALDTRDFPKGTFVKDMEIMEVFAGYRHPFDEKDLKDFHELRKSDKGYYFGEYLTQGVVNVKGRCVVTSMQKVIDAGLFELNPELGDQSKWGQLADRVIFLRESFASSQDPPTATRAEVRKAITIAGICFGNHWEFPMAIMLLALKRRQKNDPIIVGGFVAMFSESEIEYLKTRNVQSDTHRLPEVEQFQLLLDDILQRLTGKYITPLLNPFDNLTLGQS